MNQQKYTDMHALSRDMRPAEVFQPDYDSIYYKQKSDKVSFKLIMVFNQKLFMIETTCF